MADYRAQRLAKILADHKRFTAHSNLMTETNITAPSELVKQWTEPSGYKVTPGWLNEVIQKAIQYGADRELEKCCKWLENQPQWMEDLRSARRKAPSLKEQALALVEQHEDGWRPSPKDWNTIRRALEQLDD